LGKQLKTKRDEGRGEALNFSDNGDLEIDEVGKGKKRNCGMQNTTHRHELGGKKKGRGDLKGLGREVLYQKPKQHQFITRGNARQWLT